MRFLILTLGTRGDLELFLSLGQALVQRGHEVAVGSSSLHAERIQSAGIPFVQAGTTTLAEMHRALTDAGASNDPLQRTRTLAERWLRPELQRALVAVGKIARDFDGFISNLKLVLRRGAAVMPTVSVTYDPPLDLADLPRYGPPRAEVLDLVALNKRLIDPADQWEPRYCFTGFWTPSSSNLPMPAELETFLAVGRPPVVLTLGSMAFSDLNSLQEVFAAALAQTGERGVIVRGWSKGIRRSSSDSICVVDEAHYDKLFPRAAAVVHHGGVGTLSAVLRAALPSVILPQVACQKTLAEILSREALSAGMLMPDEITPDRLDRLIQSAVHDAKLRQSALVWRDQLAADGGVAKAAELTEQHMAKLVGR